MNTEKRQVYFKKTVLFVTFMMILTVLPSCAFMPKEQESLAPPLVEPPKPKYNLYTVKIGEIADQQTGGGTFVPLEEYNVSFEGSSGRLQEFNLKKMGAPVKKGELLAKLNVEDLEYSFEQMEIDIKKDKLSYEKSQLDYQQAQDDLAQAKQDVEEALDKDEMEKAEQHLKSAEKQVQKMNKDLEIQRLNMEKRDMDYQRMKERLEKAHLRSPIDGVINSISKLAVGDWVNEYQTVYNIIDPSVIYLKYVPLTGLSRYEVGMDAIVTVNSKEYEGEVVMAPSSNDEIRVDERLQGSVLISVKDLPEDVKYGDTASVTFIFDKKKDVIVIPKAGLRTYGDRNYVVVMKDGVSREKDVEKGMETPTLIEITAGLEEGEQIILQ